MKLLLDTCTFIWLVAAPDQLSERAARTVDDASTELWLSDASVWEICLKWEAGKLQLPAPPRNWIEEQSLRWGVAWLAVERTHHYRATELPRHHRDPFDRLLVAQAIERGLTIATPDAHVQKYPVATLW